MLKNPFCFALNVCIYFLLSTNSLQAQNEQLKINSATSDTMRIRMLLDASEASEDISILHYSELALAIINKNLPFVDETSKKVYLFYKAFALNDIGYVHRNFTGNIKLAIKNFEEAFVIYEQTGMEDGRTDCLANLQEAYLAIGDFAHVNFYINKGLQIQLAAKDSDGIAETYNTLASLYDTQGKLDSSLCFFRMALSIREAMGDKKNRAFIFDNIGMTYLKQGDMQKALDYFYKGYNYSEKYHEKAESSISLNHIGKVYLELNDYHRALGLFNQSLGILKKVEKKAYMPGVLINIGFVYRKLNKADSSFYFYNEALEIATEMNALSELSIIYVELGEVYIEQGDTTSALNSFRNALGVNEQLSATDRIADACCRIGNIFLAAGKTDSAYFYGARALKLSEQTTVARYSMNVNYLMYRLNSINGNYADALKQYSKYISIRDSLNNNNNYRFALAQDFEHEKEKQQLIAKAEQQKKQFQIEEQRKIIWISSVSFLIIICLGIILYRINRRRKQNEFSRNIAEQQMTALRAQMNPHFIFNSLNAIQQMVLSNDNDNAFHYLDTYSKLTRKILENSDKQWITVEEEISFLELYLSIESLRFSDAFSYQIKTSDHVSKHFNKVPPMIIQPYVENAIKHGLLNKKKNALVKIDFDFNESKQLLAVTIEDNGVGRNAAKENANTQHISKGMMITEQRIQLQSNSGINKVEIEDLKDSSGNADGTRVIITIAQP